MRAVVGKARTRAVGPAPAARAQAPPGIVRRLAALLLDAAVVSVLAFALAALLWALLGPSIRFPPASRAADAVVLFNPSLARIDALAAAAASAAYFAGAWMLFGASPAQRLLALGVRDADTGARPRADQALTRWALLWGPYALVSLLAAGARGMRVAYLLIPLAWAVVLLVSTLRSPAGRGLHDRLGATVLARSDVR